MADCDVSSTLAGLAQSNMMPDSLLAAVRLADAMYRSRKMYLQQVQQTQYRQALPDNGVLICPICRDPYCSRSVYVPQNQEK